VVELEGVKRWFERHGTAQQAEAYRQKIQRREQFTALVLEHKARLTEIYASNLSDAEKRTAKAMVFEELRSDYSALKVKWGGYADYDKWFAQDLNNAHLAAIGMYSQFVAAFKKLLAQQNDDLAIFYTSVRAMANFPENERHMTLQKF
jgi:predicted aminopeptidase